MLLLRSNGYDVHYVAESDAGRSDDEVLRYAVANDLIVITEDSDFGELVVRFRKPAVGIVLLRLFDEAPTLKAARVLQLLREHAGRLRGHHVVVGLDRVRFRKLDTSTS